MDASYPPLSDTRFASFESLRAAGLPALDPRRLILSKGDHQWCENLPVHWAWMREEIRGKSVLVPAAALSAEYDCEIAGFATTRGIGLACGSSREEACLDALLDLVRHDALAFVEKARYADIIDIETCAANVRSRVEALREDGFEVTLFVFDDGILHIPTAFAALVGGEAGRGPLISLGSAAALDLGTALERAIAHSVDARPILPRTPKMQGEAEQLDLCRHIAVTWLYSWSQSLPVVDYAEPVQRISVSVADQFAIVLTRFAKSERNLVLTMDISAAEGSQGARWVKAIVPGCEVAHLNPSRIGLRLARAIGAFPHLR